MIWIILGIYLIGILVYCWFNRDRIGEETYEYIGNGQSEQCSTDTETIVLESVFWPIGAILIIIFLPIKVLSKLLDILNKNYSSNKYN